MKTPILTEIKYNSRLVLAAAFMALFAMSWWLSPVRAEILATDTIATVATAEEIAAQELALKEKQLEFEKAKLEQQQSAALDLRKSQLELEIKKLELLKARRDLMVRENKEELEMLLEGDVLFDVNSDIIKDGAMPSLRQVSIVLSEYPKGKVTVTGYADSTGTAQNNLELSRKRGESVKTYLLGKSEGAISTERIIAQGMGETQPVATNASSAGRLLNRRVEIRVSKAL